MGGAPLPFPPQRPRARRCHGASLDDRGCGRLPPTLTLPRKGGGGAKRRRAMDRARNTVIPRDPILRALMPLWFKAGLGALNHKGTKTQRLIFCGPPWPHSCFFVSSYLGGSKDPWPPVPLYRSCYKSKIRVQAFDPTGQSRRFAGRGRAPCIEAEQPPCPGGAARRPRDARLTPCECWIFRPRARVPRRRRRDPGAGGNLLLSAWTSSPARPGRRRRGRPAAAPPGIAATRRKDAENQDVAAARPGPGAARRRAAGGWPDPCLIGG